MLAKITGINNSDVKKNMLNLVVSASSTGNGYAEKVRQLTDAVNTVTRRVGRFKTDSAEAFKTSIEESYKTLLVELEEEAAKKKEAMIAKKEAGNKAKIELITETSSNQNHKWFELKTTNTYYNYDKSSTLYSTNRSYSPSAIYFSDIEQDGDGKFFVFFTDELERDQARRNYNFNQQVNNYSPDKYHVSNMVVGKVITSHDSNIMISNAHVIIKDGKFVDFDATSLSKKDEKLVYRAVFDFKDIYANIHAYHIGHKEFEIKNIVDYEGESHFKEILQNITTID